MRYNVWPNPSNSLWK